MRVNALLQLAIVYLNYKLLLDQFCNQNKLFINYFQIIGVLHSRDTISLKGWAI